MKTDMLNLRFWLWKAEAAVLLLTVLLLIAANSCLGAPTNLVVAADGSARFKTVQEAIMAVPAGSATNPVFIHIKPGTYKELVYVQHEKRFFHLLGEDAERTVLTYNLNATMTGADGKPIGTFRTPSTTIDADDFTAENITFENSAGPVGQALAIRLDGDRAVFRRCRFLGWQDTILANRGRHYFADCYIAGHVDFIFGAATAFFEKCHIHCLRNGYMTAASTPDNQPYGFVFSHCKITGENPEVKTYLGRPWRAYASTIFLNTEMSEVVRPEGWDNWRKPEAEKTARYAEFNSTGPGADPAARVKWAKQLTAKEAEAITAKQVLAGHDGWNPTASEEVEAGYRQAIEKRTADILAVVELKDAEKISKVHDLLIAQYRALRDWHDANDAKLKGAVGDQALQIHSSLKPLHDKFISSLAAELTPAQVEKVKDKITYNKVQVTYDAYLEIVRNLTELQKKKILELLKEAREEAMDAGSADEKSAIFKKYKGKINNYLTAEGHDVKQAYKDWGEKQKAKENVISNE